jgi:hypothetical protein
MMDRLLPSSVGNRSGSCPLLFISADSVFDGFARPVAGKRLARQFKLPDINDADADVLGGNGGVDSVQLSGLGDRYQPLVGSKMPDGVTSLRQQIRQFRIHLAFKTNGRIIQRSLGTRPQRQQSEPRP